MAMLPDKKIKKWFKREASKSPEKYYPVAYLKEAGFQRKQCGTCQTYFWTVNADQTVCGDPSCVGGFSFIGNTPATARHNYVDVWRVFSKQFANRGYSPIHRYPVVARWNPTAEFTMASIAAFQPQVVNGEMSPPAKKLVLPQFCLRFGDVDNVGVTGSHLTGFVMIGQHAFLDPEEWKQAELFRDLYMWFKQGMGIPSTELTLHEDAWAGGGNFGPCMEFFSRGCELGNQVYMMYEQTPSGNKELKTKVLDMGMGQERNAWFAQGSNNIYEATFPLAVNHLKKITEHTVDEELIKRFSQYAPLLNVDEVEDTDKVWQHIAKLLAHDHKKLREAVLQNAAIYSLAEHTRSLLFALADGALPSNVGGGYNLRTILRRSLSFIDRFGWQVDLVKVAEIHASSLQKQYPELKDHIDEVAEILAVEKRKYLATKKKGHNITRSLLSNPSAITTQKLIEVYDSHGITPELIQEDARKLDVRIDVPDNFYNLVAEKHEKEREERALRAQEKDDDSISVEGLPKTKALYYDDWQLLSFTGKVVKQINNYVVLDQTAFYPTSGGQQHDTGRLAGEKVVDVYKKHGVIVHVLDSTHTFPEGEELKGVIDFERRKQLAQHHTAAHIINGAARQVLGNHVWQAGASKTMSHGRLDLTHYEQLSEEQIAKIECVANDVVNKRISTKLFFMSRDKAEATYGFRLYQGGVVPGVDIRVVEIPGFDTEACGGTHLHDTGEAKHIKIVKTSKISDAVVRIEYVAGEAVDAILNQTNDILEELSKELHCDTTQIPGRAEELFKLWKKVVKKKKTVEDITLHSTDQVEGTAEEILKQTLTILRTQPVHAVKTVRRFKDELAAKHTN